MQAKTRINQPRHTARESRQEEFCYGWVADIPDLRDLHYRVPRKLLRALPRVVDLRPHCPPVYRQGSLHSCTAHAIAAAVQFDQIKHAREEAFVPSRLFIYYNERALERSIASDSGARIRSGIKTVAKRGVCPEHLWPYRIRRFREKPRRRCYVNASKHPAVAYRRVPRTLADLRGCLASGYPFMFGFTVYESFHSAKVARTGRAPMPAKRERIRAGHAVLTVGYDDAQERFLLRNSWGTHWGRQGYFTLPYAYLLHPYLSQDFWTIRIG